MNNLKNTYLNLHPYILKNLIKEDEEIEPIGGETTSPNEFAYYDFKSWAYEVGRKELFREKKFQVGEIEYTLEEATEMGAGIMFSVLTQIWTLWTEETDNDQFGRIKDDNVNDFGKALYNMMKKDNFFFSKEERGAKVGMDQQDADYLKQTYGVEMNEKKIGFNKGPEYSEEIKDLLSDFAKSTEMINKELEKKVVAHEAVHAKEIKSGRIAYGDDWVRSDGNTYPRKDGMIKYNGEWKPEGDSSFPWEKRAEKAEKNA